MIDWRHWHNEPFLVGGIVLLCWAYAVFTGPLRPWLSPTARYPGGRAACFYASLAIFYLAVGSPLDQIGERLLLTAHMAQHQLLIYPAAILFLRGLPPWLVAPLLRRQGLRPVLRLLTRPLVCGLVYVVTLTVWHSPLLYQDALDNKLVHVLEHLMFFGAALFYWWPLLSPSTDFPPASRPGQMLYLVAVTIGMVPVCAYVTFSRDILYPTYEYAPRIIASLRPIDDQILAGASMNLVGMLVSFIAFAWVFASWYRETEGRRPDGARARA